jgi:hypothetical protein
MSTPLSMIAQGSFISTGARTVIELPKYPHYFMVKNRSTWGTNPAAVVQSEWFNGYAAGQAKTMTESGAGVLSATLVAAGGQGFNLINLTNQLPGPLVATGTAINQAAGAVVLDANDPAVGDIVRLFNTTGMLQVAGLDFTVTAVNPGVSFTLGYLDSSGFAAAATNSDYRIIPSKYYSPYRRYMTVMTAANPAVITVSVAHNYLVGDYVTLHIPAAFGTMSTFDQKTALVTAVTASTMTLDFDSTGFAFAFPTSAQAALGVSFAHVTNVGERLKVTSAMDNVGYYAIELGTAVVGAAGNVMDWVALSADITI